MDTTQTPQAILILYENELQISYCFISFGESYEAVAYQRRGTEKEGASRLFRKVPVIFTVAIQKISTFCQVLQEFCPVHFFKIFAIFVLAMKK